LKWGRHSLLAWAWQTSGLENISQCRKMLITNDDIFLLFCLLHIFFLALRISSLYYDFQFLDDAIGFARDNNNALQ
jgi:hypothetical protein